MSEYVFRGEFDHNLDAKSRIILPIKFREGLGNSFIITRGLDTCLFIFRTDVFTALEEKVKMLPISDESVRQFVRFFFGPACDCEFDAQGRVVVPAKLREYAGIEKEVVSMGLPGRIELWSSENWAIYKQKQEGGITKEIANKMTELGI